MPDPEDTFESLPPAQRPDVPEQKRKREVLKLTRPISPDRLKQLFRGRAKVINDPREQP